MSDFREQTGDAKQSDMLFVSQEPEHIANAASSRWAKADRVYREGVGRLCVMEESLDPVRRRQLVIEIAQDLATLRDMVR